VPHKPSASTPKPAAYTKAKPRVRAYMIEHRAAVRERLVDQEAEGLRKLYKISRSLHSDKTIFRFRRTPTLPPQLGYPENREKPNAKVTGTFTNGVVPARPVEVRRHETPSQQSWLYAGAPLTA